MDLFKQKPGNTGLPKATDADDLYGFNEVAEEQTAAADDDSTKLKRNGRNHLLSVHALVFTQFPKWFLPVGTSLGLSAPKQ